MLVGAKASHLLKGQVNGGESSYHIVLYQNHARLKSVIKLLLLLCTDDILIATRSNIATVPGVDCKAASKVMASVGG